MSERAQILVRRGVDLKTFRAEIVAARVPERAAAQADPARMNSPWRCDAGRWRNSRPVTCSISVAQAREHGISKQSGLLGLAAPHAQEVRAVLAAGISKPSWFSKGIQ
ncbi:MAG: hypothetical protein WDO72_07300 [Pseudomonadota bacterium]